MAEAKVIGIKEAQFKFNNMKNASKGALHESIFKNAPLVVRAIMQEAPVLTGALRRDIGARSPMAINGEVYVVSGMPYSAVTNQGFYGTDRRGRKWNRPANPFMDRGIQASSSQFRTAVANDLRGVFK